MAPALDKSGVWGKPSSTLDWCEENYVVTPYVAEFWNTISNLVMIIPPLTCCIYYWKKGIEVRYLLANISLLAVGVGSWMFHMTLLYEMQLLDELPMIYGTCVFLYALHHHAKPMKQRSSRYILVLGLCSVLVTVIYLLWKNPIFHQVSYAVLVLGLCYEALLAIRNYPLIKPLVFTSFILYLFGFILWNIDNTYCSSLRSIRAESTNYSPVKMASQLHAWWHIFTGYATYLHIVFSSYARMLHLKQSCSVKLLDELPMIYGNCIYVYSLFCNFKPPQSNKFSNNICAVTALLYGIVTTLVYIVLKNPIIFQVLYGMLVFISVFITISVCKREPSVRNIATKLHIFYLVGFILWNVDNNFCFSLRSVRHGRTNFDFFVIASQLHAWWHILSGYASFLQLLLAIQSRNLYLKKHCSVKRFIVWPYLDVQRSYCH